MAESNNDKLARLGKFIVQVGFSTAAAAFLLLVVTGIIPSPLTSMPPMLAAHVKQSEEFTEAVLKHQQDVQRLLRKICRRVSRDINSIEDCDK